MSLERKDRAMKDYNEQLLPTFEPSENEIIESALAQPLPEKIAKAIDTLKLYESKALQMSDMGYHLAFSGGKDSIVIKQLAIEAGVKFNPVYNVTTIDPPELIYFIREHHAEVTWNYHKDRKHLILGRMVDKGEPPTRLHRWCCHEFKENGGNGLIKILGVRIAESAKRAGIWTVFNNNLNGGYILAPICYWTDKDVWDFINSRNMPYCCLYDEGFKRLGCVGCPMAHRQMQSQFNRWPGYEKLWRLGFQRLWERWHGIPNRKGQPRFFEKFGSHEAFFDWWMTGKAHVEDNQCVFEDMMEQR